MKDWLASASVLPLVVLGAATQAQPAAETLEEVVVTAQRRAENLQDVPLTVNSLSANALADAGVRNLEDVKTLVAGYQGPGDNGSAAPHIRGVGSNFIQPGSESVVALYVDDVYIGASSPALVNLNNVAQVDVLKGPQGTLFGRNTTGGVVQISTRTPGDAWVGEATMDFANYGTLSTTLYTGGPLNDVVSSDIAVQARTQEEGWGTNLFTGEDVYKTDLDLGVRSRSVFRFSPDTEVQIGLDYEKNETTGMNVLVPYNGSTSVLGYTSAVRGWDADSNVEQWNETEAWGVSGRLRHDLGFADLVSITAYRRTVYDSRGSDGDATPAPLFFNNRDTQNDQFTQELRLVSPDEGRLLWTLGLFYYDAKDDSANNSSYNPVFFRGLTRGRNLAILDTESLAAYGQATLRLTDQTNLTLGARYTDETTEMDGRQDLIVGPTVIPGAPILDETSNEAPTWRVAVDHHFSDDLMVYASFNRGEKSGGFNISNISNPPYLPEVLDAYEIGVRSEWLDRRLTLNASAFSYDYSDIQVAGFIGTNTAIFNGAEAELRGVDVDFQADVTDRFTLIGTLEALESEYTSFPNATIYVPIPTGGFAPTTGSVAGNELAQAPGFSGSLTARYDIPTSWGEWRASATYYHNSGYFTEPDNRLEQPEHGLLSAALLYTSTGGHFYARLWGNNLTEEEVVNFLLTNQLNVVHKLNAPRTFGITLGYQY